MNIVCSIWHLAPFARRITWCHSWSVVQSPVLTSDHLSANPGLVSNRRQTTAFDYFGLTDQITRILTSALPYRSHDAQTHDKPILDVNAVRANRDHFCHWETRFHDYLLDGYRSLAKDRLTHAADHYIDAKRPFELAIPRSAIPSSEWNTLNDVINSKIPADDANKPWIWLKKIKEHYAGASTLMQDRYYFWV